MKRCAEDKKLIDSRGEFRLADLSKAEQADIDARSSSTGKTAAESIESFAAALKHPAEFQSSFSITQVKSEVNNGEVESKVSCIDPAGLSALCVTGVRIAGRGEGCGR